MNERNDIYQFDDAEIAEHPIVERMVRDAVVEAAFRAYWEKHGDGDVPDATERSYMIYALQAASAALTGEADGAEEGDKG